MVEFRSVGGVFWRLDASGNLTAYDTQGTVLAKFISGALATKGNRATAFLSQATTSSTPTVSSGFGISITPQVATSIEVVATGYCSNNTAGDGAFASIVRTTGTIPTLGSALGGSDVTVASIECQSATANNIVPLPLAALDTGLTVGVALKYYIGFAALTGGTLQINSVVMFGWEI